MILRKKAYARVGLMGNPSDGYFGKTIASTITNFSAEVALWESPKLEITPHPEFDSMTFDGLAALRRRAQIEGYYGGLRLLFAACKKFYDFCEGHGISLERRNFTITYDTTIPRQIGLGGSTAIITATIFALMEFYGLELGREIPKPVLPNLILSVETEELDIAAGLQDRVVQVYGGTVFMDFSEALMVAQGHGNYEYIDSRLLPPLFLAYTREGSESGKVHREVRFRYESGDPEVRGAMREFAEYAVEARAALLERDYATFGALMNRNFDLRRRIFGDKAIAPTNLEMIEIARQHGCPSKFSGSRDAIVGVCLDPELWPRLREAYTSRGYAFTPLAVEVRDEE